MGSNLLGSALLVIWRCLVFRVLCALRSRTCGLSCLLLFCPLIGAGCSCPFLGSGLIDAMFVSRSSAFGLELYFGLIAFVAGL